MIIRPVAMKDLPDLKAIAVESGPGFTSLTNDHDFLVQKIESSIASFAADVREPGNQSYLFVLEDPTTGAVMGTTGIEASVGTQRPLYHYCVGEAVKQSPELGLSRRQQTLTLGTHYTGCSEICTLFLRPNYRRAWAGKLLSRVRFLFMVQHPERFSDTVIAEMRGVCDDAGQSPFWRWLQANFIDLDFATVSQMVGTGDNGFIADLMPEHPLYTHLMDREAQEVIGEVHPQTRPALHMLKSEGFRFKGYIDPFDGGPTVEAQLSDIRSVNQSNLCRVHIRPDSTEDGGTTNSAWTNGGQGKTLMVANTETAAFRATVTQAARYLPAHQMLDIPASVARHLGLVNGGKVWFSDLEKQRNSNPFLSDTQSTTPLLEANRAH